MFWIPALSAMLNALFLMDFLAIAFTGESVSSMLFGSSGSSLADALTGYIPGMTPYEFFLANTVILIFVSVVMVVSVYIAFYSDKKECYPDEGFKVTVPKNDLIHRMGVRK